MFSIPLYHTIQLYYIVDSKSRSNFLNSYYIYMEWRKQHFDH